MHALNFCYRRCQSTYHLATFDVGEIADTSATLEAACTVAQAERPMAPGVIVKAAKAVDNGRSHVVWPLDTISSSFTIAGMKPGSGLSDESDGGVPDTPRASTVLSHRASPEFVIPLVSKSIYSYADRSIDFHAVLQSLRCNQ